MPEPGDERVYAALPTVPREERARMLRGPAHAGGNAPLLAGLPQLDGVEVAPPRDPSPDPPRSARIVCWNLERGRHLDGALGVLRAQHPDVCLLSELDWGMARSGQRHTAAELARGLGCGYAYGVEFLELGLGDEEERERHAGETNAVGYHGAAILSPHPLLRPRVVRLERSGLWFAELFGQRRVGGRMALVAELALAGGLVTLASVHLESHTDPDHRAEQLRRLLDTIERDAPGGAVLIGGDVNTSSLARSHWVDPERIRRLVRDDPERLRDPVRHEPLFALAESRGYDWRACNDVARPTQRVKSPSQPGQLHLDWFFARGLQVGDASVIEAVDPESGEPISDHEAIAITIAVA